MIELSRPARGVALIRLHRPARRNALDLDGFRRLDRAWAEVAADEDVRACVVTGGTDFSSGADLATFSDDVEGAHAAGEGGGDVWGAVHRALLRDVVLPVPVLAAVEGYCMGAGMELVGATDIRVAGESAVFALPEVRHGFIASGGSVARLPRQLGYAAAMQIMATGARFPAARMQAWGFVNEVVPDGTALQRALELADQVAANDPRAVRALKRAVGEGLRGTLAQAFDIETRISRELTDRAAAR